MSFEKMNMENDIRPDEPHKILIYGYAEEERSSLINVFKNSNENNFMFVEKYLLDNTVEDLIYNDFDNNTYSNLNENFPNVKFMMLSGFSNKELNNLFSVFKFDNVKRPIAATLTESNKKWIFKDLIKDVYEEHMTMMNRMKQMQESNSNT